MHQNPSYNLTVRYTGLFENFPNDKLPIYLIIYTDSVYFNNYSDILNFKDWRAFKKIAKK
jgi:hypothetical protein